MPVTWLWKTSEANTWQFQLKFPVICLVLLFPSSSSLNPSKNLHQRRGKKIFFPTCRWILISKRDLYNRYLSGSLRRKTAALHRRNQTTAKTTLFCTISLLRQTGNQHFLYCFPGDVSVFKRVDLKFDFPFLEKCIVAVQPCISVLAYPVGLYFVCLFFTANI